MGFYWIFLKLDKENLVKNGVNALQSQNDSNNYVFFFKLCFWNELQYIIYNQFLLSIFVDFAIDA